MELPDWSDRTVVCIATGPSLSREQIDAVAVAAQSIRRIRVLAINDAGLPARDPFTVASCDLWYAPDHRFWWHYREQLDKRRAIRVGAEAKTEMLGLVHARVREADGGHAGIQAVRLALDLGADEVILLGYDCRARGNDTNYFGRKPEPLTYGRPEAYDAWVGRYRKLYVPPGSRVINCTPGSAIDAFEFASLADVFARRIAA